MRVFFANHGSLVVLLLLCAYYSFATLSDQHPNTPEAGRELATLIRDQAAHEPGGARILIMTRDTQQDRAFAQAIVDTLQKSEVNVLKTVQGAPTDAREALELVGTSGQKLFAIATNQPTSEWGPLQPDRLKRLADQYPSLRELRVMKPPSHVWPSFLTRENLLNVINQNADIAIIAIGMTMVIITAGIDLSVGSLLAVSAVVTAISVQELAGGAAAGTFGILLSMLLGMGLCALAGLFNGVMVTYFRVPAFVVTLGMMMVARGLALIVAVRYQRILSAGTTEGTPEAVRVTSEAFGWLGNGSIFGIPCPIVLMLVLYLFAHFLMTRTSIGRYIYAVGGNPEAARLSGVPVTGVLLFVYVVCAAMAGLAGIVDASRFDGGRPSAGELYELQVIAAVVVGGTSLSGGEGRIFGTLIGALIIAVIQNGLNMAGVASYEQKVVFGLLILGAVLLDRLKTKH